MMCTVPTSNGFAGMRTVEIPETELLLDILAGTADGAFAVDENHRIAFWNESAAKILGFSSTEATGRLCYELVGGVYTSEFPQDRGKDVRWQGRHKTDRFLHWTRRSDDRVGHDEFGHSEGK